jgi:hypothetical protein
MSGRPEIVIIDDGELEDVRALLDEIGASYVRWRKSSAPAHLTEPSRLLVATASLAVSLRYRRVIRTERNAATWIAFVDGDSRSQRTYLANAGFNFLIRRPVHKGALRMLLQRSLWTGAEGRKAGGRVAVGYDVTVRSGLRRHRATLVDLSTSGCRLLAQYEPKLGAALSVQMPGQLAGGKPFAVKGSVVRVRSGDLEGGDSCESAVALRFERLDPATKKRLRDLVTALASGPATQTDGMARAGQPRWDISRSRRAHFGDSVQVLGGSKVLVARDLSSGGMRIEPCPGLHVGDRIQIAIEAGGRAEPIVARARVLRDDGPRGLALRFEEIETWSARRLEGLLEKLPPLQELKAGSGRRRPIFISRLVSRLLGSD